MSDLISRKDTIAWLKKVTVTDGITFETGFKQIIRDIEQMPSVTPERPHGYWIWNKRTGDYECSECGCNPIYERTTPDCSEIDKYKFCRWCGAKMMDEQTLKCADTDTAFGGLQSAT